MTPLTTFWSVFYHSHQGWLRGWLSKKTGCRHLAEDLTHDIFLKLPTLAEPEAIRNPRAYLMVTANHVMIDQSRKRKLEEDALAALAQLAEGAEAQSAEQRVAISQLVATALRVLNEELDEKVQRAFIMARVEGHSYRDIAVTLGVSESSVKQYLAKAMIHFHTRIFTVWKAMNQKAELARIQQQATEWLIRFSESEEDEVADAARAAEWQRWCEQDAP